MNIEANVLLDFIENVWTDLLFTSNFSGAQPGKSTDNGSLR